jgi:hypothetical protein
MEGKWQYWGLPDRVEAHCGTHRINGAPDFDLHRLSGTLKQLHGFRNPFVIQADVVDSENAIADM